MGYHTEIKGGYVVTGNITPSLVSFVNEYNKARHYKVNMDAILLYFPSIVEQHGLNGSAGKNGEFLTLDVYHYGKGFADYNTYNPSCPDSFWCQWALFDDYDASDPISTCYEINEKDALWLKWDGGEKFYEYEEWLRFLILNVFEPNGVLLNGAVITYGEGYADSEYIVVKNNEIILVPSLSSNSKNKLRSLCSTDILNKVYAPPSRIESYWSC